MKNLITFYLGLIAVLGLMACKSGSSDADLKSVQQQKSGEYTVSILTNTGKMNQGSSTFFLEFRKTSGSQLSDVGKVEVSPVMEMSGMAPMIGEANVVSSGTPGRYEVKGSLGMSGLWKINVKFGDNQSVRFSLSAE